MMKNIFLFTDTPLVGGAELHMFLLAKFLKNRYKITLICLSNSSIDPWCKKFEKEGISVLRLPFSYKNDPRIFFALRKILHAQRPNIFHAHLWNPASNRFGLLAAKIAGVPLIVTEHDPFPLPLFKRWLKKWFVKDAKAIIAISAENQSFLQKDYQKDVALISNGIDVEEWKRKMVAFSQEERAMIRKTDFQVSASADDFIILNVATLHERKGQETLLRGFSEFIKKALTNKNRDEGGLKSFKMYPRLIFVGEGEHRRKFEELAKKLGIETFVKFLGQRNDIPKLLFASDLFILPSHREGFGLALLEAGMAKLPVIASNVGGIPDIIEDGKDGILIPPKNPEALAKALYELMEDKYGKEKQLRFASALHEKVMNQFGAKRMAEKTSEVYDKIP